MLTNPAAEALVQLRDTGHVVATGRSFGDCMRLAEVVVEHNRCGWHSERMKVDPCAKRLCRSFQALLVQVDAGTDHSHALLVHRLVG